MNTPRPHIVATPAVPFDEDDRIDGIWYLDHDFLEQMSTMFKKVSGAAAWFNLILRNVDWMHVNDH